MSDTKIYPLIRSVLDLDAFERCNKAEGLGMSGEGGAQVKNLHDADLTIKLFRFLQLLCEGHNLGNYAHKTPESLISLCPPPPPSHSLSLSVCSFSIYICIHVSIYLPLS